jgi:hypothetical protein
LKSPVSTKGIQGNARIFLFFIRLCLVLFGSTYAQNATR